MQDLPRAIVVAALVLAGFGLLLADKDGWGWFFLFAALLY